ncbi:hypothetical protein LOTGIDRAFT_175692 [Lottia gigantea]|uniref:Uncharacterized protein n=1 Tax=Lottia gigantea TaxID=225164 RepID=V4A6Z2_LOTGI|nr:hypothetical protein LOTGIDRAFT_175692 [Lottia gigantea]ESO92487.1 hypothetical protein LOTGIDRAFT_175692 [Lottia gigantea]
MTLLGRGNIRVYRGGVLRQRGSGFLSGLMNMVKKGAVMAGKSLWSAGKKAIKENLPQVGKEVLKVVQGKETVKSGWKNIVQDAVKPALKSTVSETLKNVVVGIKDRQPPRKRTKSSAARSVNIKRKRRKKDIFDHGFNDA